MASGQRSEGPGNSYRGALGSTHRKRVLYTCPCGALRSIEVYAAVDVSADPELGQRLVAEDLDLNTLTCGEDGSTHAVHTPVVYHDPRNKLLLLVLSEGMRHRELEERAALLSELARDPDAGVPPYVREFSVVYGSHGLAHFLESAAEQSMEAARVSEAAQELDRDRSELEEKLAKIEARQAEFDRIASELDRSSRELSERTEDLDAREAALDRRSTELGRESERLAAAEERFAHSRPIIEVVDDEDGDDDSHPGIEIVDSDEASRAEKAPLPNTGAGETDPFERVDMAELHRLHVGEAESSAGAEQSSGAGDSAQTEDADDEEEELQEVEPEPVGEGEVIVADQIIEEGRPELAPAPISLDGKTRVGGRTDVAIERWIVSRENVLKMIASSGRVRLGARLDPERLEELLCERLGLRLQMHPMPTYALVTLAIGRPEVIRGEGDSEEPFVFRFDVASERDRPVVEKLGREFTFLLELYDMEYLPVRKRMISAELEDNMNYVLAAAEEHLAGIPMEDRSFEKACSAHDEPDYDRFGWRHEEHNEFREEKLQKLATPQDVRRALAMARRFSAPELESYLVLTRGYSLRQWQSQRRAVLERAVEIGLWVGNTLAQVAVSEGIARSRKDLVRKLMRAFAHHVSDGKGGLDEDTVRDNWAVLEQESSSLGITPLPEPVRAPLDTDQGQGPPIITGTIPGVEVEGEGTPTPIAAPPPRPPVPNDGTVEELISLLEDKDRRLEAAVQLATRGEELAIGPVFNSLRRMTRGEAVRVLGAASGFGDKATAHLIDGLRSRKSFLRHGCALALSVLGREEGVEAVCDLLVSEPTEIWREVARAVGHAGPAAVMSLASRLSSASSQPENGGAAGDIRERIAWALAYVAAEGGQQPVTTLAGGRDPLASSVATRALELTVSAREENRELKGTEPPREQTVNRAFTRRFFQALEGAGRDGAKSSEAVLLDEADLIDATDLEDAEPLDDSDLIPT